MSYSVKEAAATLHYVSTMSIACSNTRRYEGNPHVTRKDSVHEHIARIVRLATVVLPILKTEFAEQKDILDALNQLQTIVSVHDDEEALDPAGDIATFAKTHDVNNAHEVALVAANLAQLTKLERNYLVDNFSTFRKRKENTGAIKMVGDIAKVLDNIVGNQLAIEDRVGLIQPDYAIACLNYVRDYRGKVCKTIDALIEAQIEEMLSLRNSMKTDGSFETLAMQWAGEQKENYATLVQMIKAQLAVNLDTHPFDKSRCYTPVWQYPQTLENK